jgi:hypothetical protein
LGALSFVWPPTFGSADPFDQPGANLSPNLLEDLVRLGVLDQQQASGVRQMVVAAREKVATDGEPIVGDLGAFFEFAAFRRFSTQSLLSGGGIDDFATTYPGVEEVELE